LHQFSVAGNTDFAAVQTVSNVKNTGDKQ